MIERTFAWLNPYQPLSKDCEITTSSAETYVMISYGRATSLLWKTVDKKKLKNNRYRHEDELLLQLRNGIPESVKVTILVDRGCCDTKRLAFMSEALKFDDIIRSGRGDDWVR